MPFVCFSSRLCFYCSDSWFCFAMHEIIVKAIISFFLFFRNKIKTNGINDFLALNATILKCFRHLNFSNIQKEREKKLRKKYRMILVRYLEWAILHPIDDNIFFWCGTVVIRLPQAKKYKQNYTIIKASKQQTQFESQLKMKKFCEKYQLKIY